MLNFFYIAPLESIYIYMGERLCLSDNTLLATPLANLSVEIIM